MGYMLHHAIIVHSFDHEMVAAAHRKASDLGMRPSEITKPDPNNGNVGFYMPPDGSKEGWAPSDDGDTARDRFVEWLLSRRHDDGSNNLDWVEFAFGGDEALCNTRVVRAGEWERP